LMFRKHLVFLVAAWQLCFFLFSVGGYAFPAVHDLPVLFEPVQLAEDDGTIKREFRVLKKELRGTAKSVRLVRVNFQLLESLRRNDKVLARLWSDDDTKNIQLELHSRDQRTNTKVIYGRLDGIDSEVLIVTRSQITLDESGTRLKNVKRLVANIDTTDLHLTYRFFNDDFHLETESEVDRMHGDLREPERPNAKENPSDTTENDNSLTRQDTVVTFGFFYTQAALNAAKGQVNIELACTHCVEQLNKAFSNSKINATAEMVFCGMVKNFDEAKYWTKERIEAFRKPDDGIIDEIHTTRKDTKADICFLLTDTLLDLPLAYRMRKGENVPQFFKYAFGTGDFRKAIGQLSFAHEVGHIFGCCHKKQSLQNDSPLYDFARPFLHPNANQPEIMTLLASGGLRICFYSSPDLEYESQTFGTITIGSEYKNNRKTILKTINLVSEFMN